ncbi:MAG: mercuric transporter MerT family protein [Methylococcaceae bacterium]|jgi:mercuric ion transport protein|nr:mercuric transporter MerT family protein [Methylococcaceae bacterium]
MMTTEHETPDRNTSWLGLGAALAAIGASVCCVGPFLLLSLGVGGAWISTLTSLSPVRPVFLILTLVFIGLGYRKLYLKPGSCKEDEVCVLPEVEQKQRTIFWVVSVFILLLLAFPWYAPFFME